MREQVGKHLHKSKIKMNMNIPLRVAAVLLCLGLFSGHSVTGLYARYAGSVQSDDQARVAKFFITAEATGTQSQSQSIDADLIPGETETVSLEITNKSEVAVEYTIVVKNETNNLPLRFTMEKVGASADLSADGATYTTQRLPGEYTDKYKLTIDWPAAADQDRDPDRMGMVDHISVTVTATQTD